MDARALVKVANRGWADGHAQDTAAQVLKANQPGLVAGS